MFVGTPSPDYTAFTESGVVFTHKAILVFFPNICTQRRSIGGGYGAQIIFFTEPDPRQSL